MENLVDFVYSQTASLNDDEKMSLGFPFEILNQYYLIWLHALSLSGYSATNGEIVINSMLTNRIVPGSA